MRAPPCSRWSPRPPSRSPSARARSSASTWPSPSAAKPAAWSPRSPAPAWWVRTPWPGCVAYGGGVGEGRGPARHPSRHQRRMRTARLASVRDMETLVEHGGAADVDLLEPLWLAVHRQHQRVMPELRPYVTDVTTWRERRSLYQQLFAEHGAILLLARDGDRLVGYGLGYTMPVAGTWLADTWVTGDRVAEIE